MQSEQIIQSQLELFPKAKVVNHKINNDRRVYNCFSRIDYKETPVH